MSSSTEETSFTKMDEKDPMLIGSHCQYTYCNQLDFLPFRCESCFHTFCLEHRSETTHQCPRAGEWAARKRAAAAAATSQPSSGSTKPTTQSMQKPCSSPSCKTIIGTSLTPDIHCQTCNRDFCLKHRLKEDHDCKNLIPIGARPATNLALQTEKAKVAFGKLKAWGTAQKEAVISQTTTRTLPLAKPSSKTSRMVALNSMKKSAKGDSSVPMEKRIYIFVEAEAATTMSKFPRGEFFYSREWVVGKVLDAAAKSLGVENFNNRSAEERDRLRVFHVEGGRVLGFGERVGTCLVSGNTVVLLRGVGGE